MSKRAKPDEWMPLYVGKYLQDTTFLTTEQHGAYLLLLMTYWTQQGPLPDDDKQLAAIVKASQKRWKVCLRPGVETFFQIRDGKWFQKRAQTEINRAVDISETRSIAGKAGGLASAATRTKPQANGTANRQANTQANADQTLQQNATPLPLHLNTSAAELYAPRARLQKLCEVLKVSPATSAGVLRKWPEELAQLQASGFDFERHILPAAEHAISRGADIKSLNYLRGKAAELLASESLPSEPFEFTDDEGWRKRLKVSEKIAAENNVPREKAWPAKWGPPPGAAGCKVPPELLETVRQ